MLTRHSPLHACRPCRNGSVVRPGPARPRQRSFGRSPNPGTGRRTPARRYETLRGTSSRRKKSRGATRVAPTTPVPARGVRAAAVVGCVRPEPRGPSQDRPWPDVIGPQFQVGTLRENGAVTRRRHHPDPPPPASLPVDDTKRPRPVPNKFFLTTKNSLNPPPQFRRRPRARPRSRRSPAARRW